MPLPFLGRACVGKPFVLFFMVMVPVLCTLAIRTFRGAPQSHAPALIDADFLSFHHIVALLALDEDKVVVAHLFG